MSDRRSATPRVFGAPLLLATATLALAVLPIATPN
jgi:hypothetical protein